MKRKTTFLLLALMLLTLACGTLTAQPGMQMGRLRITLAADSTFDSASLYINNELKGTITRGNTVEHVVPFGGGRQAVVRVLNGQFTAERTVTLVPGRWVNVSLSLVGVRYGQIQVTHAADSSQAFADVQIDGVNKGRINRGMTRTFPDMSAGTHTVTLIQGGLSESAGVTVVAGQTASISLALRQQLGTITVTHANGSAFPNATLYLNDGSRGMLQRGRSMTIAQLPAGTYTVRLDQGGQSTSASVNVIPGGNQAVSLSLSRPTGTVQVTHDAASAVAVAELSADGTSFGNINRGQTMSISLAPGRHTVSLSAEGRTTQAPLTVQQGRTVSLTIGLRPVTGAIRVTHDAGSAFPNATLFVDNVNRGMLARGNGIVIENLPARTYVVRLAQANREASANVTVTAGATVDVALRLERPTGTVQVTHDAASAVAVAELSADGTSFGNINRGQTMSISLEPGRHTISLSAEGRTTRAPVTVQQGRTVSLTIGLRPVTGAIRVTHDAASAFPNATLFVDNVNRGMLARGNSIVIENLPTRTYAVRLAQANREASANVTVTAGATVDVALRLERPTGTVQVTHDAASAVAVAELSADGISFGNINRGQTMSISLAPGRHTVSLSAEGRTTQAPVTVQQGRTVSLTIGLRPVNGTIRVTHSSGSAFTTATVFINDQQRGTIRRGQSLNFPDVSAGTHTVRLDQDGQSSSATVSVAAGQTAAVSLSLTRPIPTGTITVIYEQGRAPQANILVGGVLKGTVRRGQSLNIGSYPANTQVVVQVRHGNQTQNVTVNVRPDSELPAGTNRLVLRLN